MRCLIAPGWDARATLRPSGTGDFLGPSMYEFDTFVYLDMQKTGSSFVAGMLKRFCSDREIRRDQHEGLSADYDPSKFYFISVRDPLDQYLSLYSFGCQDMGRLFNTLNKKGLGNLYDGTWNGFRAWLRFVLAPGNASALSEDYAGCGDGRLSKLVGFQSYRVLSLAIPNANEVLSQCSDRSEIVAQYRAKSVVNFTIRYENFREDLAELLTTKLKDQVSDIEEALNFVRNEKPRNQSDRIDRYETQPSLGPRLKELLRDREWFMHEEFGY